ncbi:MAG: threonine synthase, partial [Deltaproteobacteria bacterium RIFOXYC2_FULL_48_10]
VSPIQELQMTTVTDANVFNLAVRGTFDDGQAIVKTIFNDLSFKEKHQLGAINSINWARIVAQVVYYVYAALKLTGSEGVTKVDFSVPTGNFGDIFAGFVARRMLPAQIRRLILATNENNLLTRFVLNGDYSLGQVRQTSSPSMDIQLASNFERYLYYLNGEDPNRTRQDMERFAAVGNLQFDELAQERVRADFASRSVNEEETKDTIRDFYQQHDYVLDPHTAVGVKAGLTAREPGVPMICLATAHPAKFGEAVRRAIGHEPELPTSLAGLAGKETRCEVMAAEVGAVQEFVERHAL